ncbi:hypothetical protein BST93_03310 [Nonlabens tegetincola]|uniref:hypothetical protein n=1 Tax=Nonlabens tegetincola TaxID=323273 RepID=UPI000D4976D8|nr:hypothetical protein BST93_03310 [Nonlabens tegetincola]
MTKKSIYTAFSILLILFLQVFVLDHVYFLGFINPIIYVIILLLYPVEHNRALYLIAAFLLGLLIDTFQDTGGAHATSCLVLAFSRPFLLRIIYGESYKMKNLKIIQSNFDRLLLLLILGILIHHFIFFNLIYFNMSHILMAVKDTFAIGGLSLLISLLVIYLVKPKVVR